MDARTLDKINTMKGKGQAVKEFERTRLELRDQLVGEVVEIFATMGITFEEAKIALYSKWKATGGWIR